MSADAYQASSEITPRDAGRPAHAATRAIVGLIGNPNTGKTTVFNALTGYRRKVANYPGVTVDVGRGLIRGARRELELLDLPGTYSLAAVSPDEMLVSNTLFGRGKLNDRPDVILAIVDATNIQRNLYLVSQLLDLGIPIVLALNMVDVARNRGIEIDVEVLSSRLKLPVIPVVATQPGTVRPLVAALEQALSSPAATERASLSAELTVEAQKLADESGGNCSFAEALRVLLAPECCDNWPVLEGDNGALRLQQARERLATVRVDTATEVRARYVWVQRILDGVISRAELPVKTWSDRLDRMLTHRIGGAAALLIVLFLVFQVLFSWAGPLMESIEATFGALGSVADGFLPAGVVRSLIVDGVIGGVGGVLVFLPQIMLLFAFIAILEDCGYMARAAFMVDRIMRTVGLSGRAFIPLLSAFACTVPAIMGTRVISDRRERYITIMIAPFMSCSARLPVYVLLISAFVPATAYLGGWLGLQGLVMLGMYLLGVVIAIPVAWLLRHTAFAGPGTSFMLELPGYKRPRLRAIWQRTYFGGRSFVIRAGTAILLVNLIVWALGYFPRSQQTRQTIEHQAQAEQWDAHRQAAELEGAYLRDSYLGRMGRAIEPAIAPIGWDWRVGVAVIASFPAREVVVATLGTISNLGSGQDEQSVSLQTALQQMRWEGSSRPVFTLPVALSVMVFFALCAQCSATLITMGREMHSWFWPILSFVSMTLLAYLAAWGTAAAASALLY
ncbi:MAG: ferrous iron transport protein B [Planctomycetota bacterium]